MAKDGQPNPTKERTQPMTSLTDPEILRHLIYGYHLEPQELKRADQIIHSITQELKSRIRKATK